MNDKQSFHKILTTGIVLNSFVMVFLLTAMGCGTVSPMKAGPEVAKPAISVTPTVAEYKGGVSVLIAGSGFEPKQKIKVFTMMGGVSSGIHYMMTPEPVANDLGAFASVWKIGGSEISGKLIEPLPVVYTIAVMDKDGKTLCTAPLAFCDLKAKDQDPACTLKTFSIIVDR